MQLSKEAIEEYKKIYKEVEGKEISDEEAREQGTRIINLFRVFLRVDGKGEDKRKYEKSKVRKIVNWYNMFEEQDPDISTERLLQMVADQATAYFKHDHDVGHVAEALEQNVNEDKE